MARKPQGDGSGGRPERMYVVYMGMTTSRILISDLEGDGKTSPLPAFPEALRGMAKPSLLIQVKMLIVFPENVHCNVFLPDICSPKSAPLQTVLLR